MVAGVMTQEALRRRQIDHALSLAVVDTKKGEWLWPAQRTDGGLDDPGAIPEGARLRLPADFDVDAVQGPPLVKLLARAAQRYGIIVRDRSFGPTVFYAEDPGKGRPDAVKALLDGATPGDALKQFPWSELQVVDARSCNDASEPCMQGEERAQIDVSPGAPQAFEPTVLDTGASTLDQPRADVRWDLDGDGSYERRTGTAVTARVEFDGVGERKIGVRIAMRDGDVVTARRTIRIE
jgi:hypothetical protein